MAQRGKAFRRAQNERMKKRVQKFRWVNPEDKRQVGILSQTPKPCACSSCNDYPDPPHREWKKNRAIQEQISEIL